MLDSSIGNETGDGKWADILAALPPLVRDEWLWLVPDDDEDVGNREWGKGKGRCIDDEADKDEPAKEATECGVELDTNRWPVDDSRARWWWAKAAASGAKEAEWFTDDDEGIPGGCDGAELAPWGDNGVGHFFTLDDEGE